MSDTTARNLGLRQMLRRRRRDMQDDVQSRIHRGRTDRASDVRDDLEHSDANIQGDIEVLLLQMRADAVARIDAALVRLDAGQYGSCFDCEREITERRLCALPFAVRCQTCEEKREETQRHARGRARGRVSLFPEMAGA